MVADVDEVLAAFVGFHPAVLGVLNACPTVQKWAIYEDVPLFAWHGGRVVLLGDACHPMTPYMQQGAATAIEDAVVLARCLQEAAGADFKVAFGAYEASRRERASKIQLESAKNRWNRDGAGSSAITHEFVYTYDAWSVPLAA
jgi:salicylate hydroxylase/6-hydroxynicotinate 3-monooxygenase